LIAVPPTGLRNRGAFVCVALTLAVGDNVSIHYVATEAGPPQSPHGQLAAVRGNGRRVAEDSMMCVNAQIIF
jgi:hypothetical protein